MKDILIVEDDLILVSFYKKMFPNCTVRVAQSGEHALQKIQEKKPDLLILDINLHGKDGLYVLKNADITFPVVVLSNSPEQTVDVHVLWLQKIAVSLSKVKKTFWQLLNKE